VALRVRLGLGWVRLGLGWVRLGLGWVRLGLGWLVWSGQARSDQVMSGERSG
jgi:hypothetical protein